MANFGRFACVLLPFVLTAGAVIALLVAALAGVADKSLYMFQVNATDLSISPLSIDTLLSARQFHDPNLLDKAASAAGAAAAGSNITAADLGLYNLYDVSVWGYCFTRQDGSRECTKPAFNWAEGALNATQDDLNTLITLSGQNVTLPSGITDAVKAFGTVARWTQIVFIIAFVALALELFFGIFANCSRAFSCVAFIVSLFATVAVCGAAALSTAMSVVVVGAVEGSAKLYGVQGSFNTKFLAAVWIAAAFAIAAGFFWMFTVCCCKPDHSRRNRRSKGGEAEKLMHGPYQPIGDHGNGYQSGGYGQQQQYPQYAHAPQSYGNGPKRDVAYEPYSHAAS